MYRHLFEQGLLCTGCGACVNVCPYDAIEYIADEEKDGSLVARIIQERCVSCKKCEQICPMINEYTNENNINPNCYAVWAEDEIREVSSSGGVFTLLANEILDNHGYICAVAYGDKFAAEHIIISDKNDLWKLRRSKYFQSRVGYVFREVQRLLQIGSPLLFVGCPCQVAGLKAYLGKEYENLILVDIYCNYTPPYTLFKKYLEDNYNVEEINKINFRIKKYGWICDIHALIFKDGHIEEKREFNDTFQRGYHSKLFMRRTCEQCKFAGMPREGDFSIADFWYIKDVHPELDDTKGTSCLLSNNEKSEKFLKKIYLQMQMCQQVSLECMKYNRGPLIQAHPSRDRFYELIKDHTFDKAVDYALTGKYDAVIWGNWSEKNYGSELTYYALYEVVASMGLHPLMVERPENVSWPPNEKLPLFLENPYPKDAIHPLYPNKSAMVELNQKSDVFIVGSDQIWHRDLYEPFGSICYLDYIYNSKKKIAYASSFGREYWSGNTAEAQEVSMYLQDFDCVSVRESSGIEICKERFNVLAKCVLDPVFLCDKSNYIKLAQKSLMKTPERYIGVYMLDINKEKQTILEQVKEALQLPLNIISDAFKKNVELNGNMEVMTGAHCEDWLRNIIDCEFVITDSFHGMCFAILFNKPFIAIVNQERGAVRFVDFLKKLGLMSRLIFQEEAQTNVGKILQNDIEYEYINELIRKEAKDSFDWLEVALKTPKESHLTRYDILTKKMLQFEYKMCEENSDHVEQLGARLWDIQVHRSELDGHLVRINNLAEESNACLRDIKINRSEMDEYMMRINDLTNKLDECLMYTNHIIQNASNSQCRIVELEKLYNDLKEHENSLEHNWLIRLSRKISEVLKKN